METIRKRATALVVGPSIAVLAAAWIVSGFWGRISAQEELISWTVAKTGDPYPDVAGETYESLGPAVQDGFGLVFRAQGEGGTDGIIDFRNRATAATPLVTDVSPAPGGGTYDSFDPVLIAGDEQSDDVAFVATAGGKQGLFLHDGSPAQYRVATEGDAISGTTSTISTFTHLSFANGKIIFAAELNPGGAGAPEEGVYLVYTAEIIAGTGAMETVFDTTTEIPGNPGETYSEFQALSARGPNLAVIAGTSAAKKVAVVHNAETLQQRALAFTGDPVPGGSGIFTDFTALDVTEGMVGVATLNDSGGSLLFLYTVRTGVSASITESEDARGENVSDLTVRAADPDLNLGIRDRQVAISVRFVAAETELTQGLGIHWGLIGGTQLHKLIATGDSVDGGIVNDLQMSDKSLDGSRFSLRIGVTDGGKDKDMLLTYRIAADIEREFARLLAAPAIQTLNLHNGAATPGGLTFPHVATTNFTPTVIEVQSELRYVDPTGNFDDLPFDVPPSQSDPVPEHIPLVKLEFRNELSLQVRPIISDTEVHIGLLPNLANEDTGIHSFSVPQLEWREVNTWVQVDKGVVFLGGLIDYLSTGEIGSPYRRSRSSARSRC